MTIPAVVFSAAFVAAFTRRRALASTLIFMASLAGLKTETNIFQIN